MALTPSDMNRIDYLCFRNKGYSDEKIKKIVGDNRFNIMKEDMKLTNIESHFGKPKEILFTIASIGLIIILIKFTIFIFS